LPANKNSGQTPARGRVTCSRGAPQPGRLPSVRTAAQRTLGALALLAIMATAAAAGRYRVLPPDGIAPFTVVRTEAWPGPGARIMVIAPHPDDETLGGEMVLRLAVNQHLPARVLLITCGDGFRGAARAQFHRAPSPADMIHLGQIRQKETLHAARAMGLKPDQVVFLGFPDGGTLSLWSANWLPTHRFRSRTTGVDHCPYANALVPGAPYCGTALLSEIESQLMRFRPTDIYVSHAWDKHPDHVAANLFLTAALSALSGEPFARHVRLHPYLVHADNFPLSGGYHPSLFMNPPDALRSNGLTWSELRLTPGQVAYRKNLIDLYSTQDRLTRPFLESLARRSVLFGEVPPAQVRRVAWSPERPHWTSADTYYSEIRRAPHSITREQAVSTPEGLLMRIESTDPSKGTLCRIFIHPLLRPGPGRVGPALASLGRAPAYLGTRLIVLTAPDKGRVSVSGGRRIDGKRSISLLLPRSLFSGASQAYIYFRLIRAGHELRSTPWRVLNLPVSAARIRHNANV